MNVEIVNRVIAVLQKYEKNGKDINVDTDIAADLELDSLAVMDVIIELEESMNITIPLNLIPDIRTVGDLAKTLEQLSVES
ncbi:MAG: acyl carrier protein [Geminicoccaceae bacterium]